MSNRIAPVFLAAISLVAAVIAPGTSAADTIYSFTDEHGVVWLSNTPVDPRYKPVLTYSPTREAAAATADAAPPPRAIRSEHHISDVPATVETSAENAAAGASEQSAEELSEPSNH